jgi:hypothetical protein
VKKGEEWLELNMVRNGERDATDEPARSERIGLTCLTSGTALSQLLKKVWNSPFPIFHYIYKSGLWGGVGVGL